MNNKKHKVTASPRGGVGSNCVRVKQSIAQANSIRPVALLASLLRKGEAERAREAHGVGSSRRHGQKRTHGKCSVIGDRMQDEVTAFNTGSPRGNGSGVHALEKRSRRTAPRGSQSAHKSASNAGTGKKNATDRRQRRVTTAGTKGHRKMEAK